MGGRMICAKKSKIGWWLFLGTCSFLALIVLWQVIASPSLVSHNFESYNKNENEIKGMIDKGWLPTWFPHSAHNINAEQTTFDSSFLWAEFRYAEGDDFLKNCTEKNHNDIVKPPAEFMKRFSPVAQKSYHNFLSESSAVYECLDGKTMFYVGVVAAAQKAYLWLEDW